MSDTQPHLVIHKDHAYLRSPQDPLPVELFRNFVVGRNDVEVALLEALEEVVDQLVGHPRAFRGFALVEGHLNKCVVTQSNIEPSVESIDKQTSK